MVLDSANQFGKKNIGNTLLFNWAAVGNGAYDVTKYFNNKLSFRLYRNTADSFGPGSGAVELSVEPDHSPYSDPTNHVPWTGNIPNEPYKFQDGPGNGAPSASDPISDGTLYFYQLQVVDDTSPDPNYVASASLSQVPMDRTPPGEVTGLTANPDFDLGLQQYKITLEWENPKDLDLAGVVILRTSGINNPVGSGDLGSAQAYYPYDDGPDYSNKIGAEPFGAGKGKIIYVSPQASDPSMADNKYEDTDVSAGDVFNYKIYTYDRANPWQPREMGRNYSKTGAAVSRTAGIPPKPISDFAVTIGANPGEVNFSWTNSPDLFCAGTLIRYSTNDKLKFGALKDQNAGDVLGVFPVTSGPGMQEIYAMNLAPGATYYFKAFSYNQTAEDLNPADPLNMAKHLFSRGQPAAINFVQGRAFVYTYDFKPGINYFAIPFPAQTVVDANGNFIDISTLAKLVDYLNYQAGSNAVVALGRWNSLTQKAVGIVSIDYSKVGNTRFTCTPGISPDNPVVQGEALVVTVNRAFTHSLKAIIQQ
jgi:hypothetical protein